MTAKVKREGDRVWIEGVEKLTWRTNNTYMGALEAALRARGEDVSYAYLMGVSGMAFRLQLHEEWCPSSPDAGCGFNTTRIAIDAIGYAYKDHNIKDSKSAEAARAREAVKRSIDAGRPVIGLDLKVCPDYGLIVGYAKGGEEFLCRTFYDKGEDYSAAEKWPWGITFVGEKGEVPDRKRLLVESLERAVMLARTESFGKYASGFAAYEKWTAELLGNARFEKADEKRLKQMNHANAWIYVSLLDARVNAMEYLRSMKDDFEGEVAEHVSKAADLYDEIFQKLKGGRKHAPFPRDLKEGESWTTDMRHAEADVLKQALAIEKKAVDEIETALLWADEVPGQVRPESLVRFALRNVDVPKHVPYLGAGVPAAIVQMLNHADTKMDYAELTAATGWAFSFSYKYDNWHVAALSVEDFAFLPRRLGYEIEYLPCRDREGLWEFVRQHTDAETPMVCTHIDGGLVYGYREKDGKRQFWFDATVGAGWIDVDAPHPLDTCAALVKEGRPRPQEEILREALARAVEMASPHERKGVPQGVAALEAYLGDVEDPGKDFEKVGEWFCWAAFERLEARWCCAVWLRRAAGTLGGDAGEALLAAAAHYEKAHGLYEQYRRKVQDPDKPARTPERIAVVVPILRQAIEAERAGIAEIERALDSLRQ